MALGLNLNGSGSGDIIPYVKYDSRAGRVSRSDRKQGPDGSFFSELVDITSNFKAVFDMENIEVGYFMFAAGSAPQCVVAPIGAPMPARPTGEGWKQGVRVMVKLHQSCGGDVREMSSNATSFLRGFNILHDAYEAAKQANAGKLPVVSLISTQPVTSGQGAKKSTNYQPHFEITGWVTRPADLIFVSKATPHKTAVPAVEYAAPPSTGSTVVSPPAAAVRQPAMAEDDFG